MECKEKKPKYFKGPYLVIVEGEDDCHFLRHFCANSI